jgi:hypothetical protein
VSKLEIVSVDGDQAVGRVVDRSILGLQIEVSEDGSVALDESGSG